MSLLMCIFKYLYQLLTKNYLFLLNYFFVAYYITQATDPDEGLSGEVRYSLDIDTSKEPPFRIDSVSGNLYTKDFTSEDRASKALPYTLIAQAYDLSIQDLGSKSVRANVYVSGKYLFFAIIEVYKTLFDANLLSHFLCLGQPD